MPRYQDTFAREAQWALTLGSGMLPEAPKILDFTTLTAVCCNVQKTYYLLHFTYILVVSKAPKCRCLGYPKPSIWVLVTTVLTYRYHTSTFSILVTTLPPYLAPACLLPDTRDPDPGCQDIKISSRARPNGPLPWDQACCPRLPQSSISRP